MMKCPLLFKWTEYIECGPGWYALLNDLCRNLEKLIEKYIEEHGNEYYPCASQVKEKYGSLRFYMSTSTDKMEELIKEAEDLSAKICEVCGKAGKVYADGWVVTRCEECYQKANSKK